MKTKRFENSMNQTRTNWWETYVSSQANRACTNKSKSNKVRKWRRSRKTRLLTRNKPEKPKTRSTNKEKTAILGRMNPKWRKKVLDLDKARSDLQSYLNKKKEKLLKRRRNKNRVKNTKSSHPKIKRLFNSIVKWLTKTLKITSGHNLPARNTGKTLL